MESSDSVQRNEGPGGTRKTTGQPEEVCGLPCSSSCVKGEGVQDILTLFCGGAAQTYHDDRVVELKEQLGIEEVDGEGQERQVKEEGRDRDKENAPWVWPWMTINGLRT